MLVYIISQETDDVTVGSPPLGEWMPQAVCTGAAFKFQCNNITKKAKVSTSQMQNEQIQEQFYYT